jgi:arylsulfatase A-like enzyme/Tfp pilus assembly protein PilF
LKKKHKGTKSSTKTVQQQPVVTTPSSPRRRKPFLILIILLLAIVGSAIFFFQRFNSASVVSGQFKDYNVLLITIDTLRADHLPAYGYSNVKTPNLDRIASESYLFNRAYAHVPLTFPSHSSILTGRLPISHGVRDNGGYHLEDSETTLAEVLKSKGYTTAGFVSAFILDSVFNLQQGFDFYYDNFDVAEYQGLDPRSIQRRADEIEAEAEHWLDQNSNKKFFAWVHFYDPHDPYNPPEPYRSEYSTEPYDGEIAFTDEYVGKLVSKLESSGQLDRTILIVTGDHGEGLGEHGESTHGMFIYNSTMHVPLFIRLPHGKKKIVDAVVGHIDLEPTILDMLGIPIPANVNGASLLPVLQGKEKKERFAYVESLYCKLHYGWSGLEGITSQKYKYIQAPRPEFFDLEKDAKELQNVEKENNSLARVMKSQLQEIISQYGNKNAKAQQKVDPEVEEKLRSLGYIGASVSPSKESESIDPKDKIHLAVKAQEAAGAALENKYQLALQLIEPVLKEEGQLTEGLYVAGVAYAGVGDYDRAIDTLQKVLAITPDHAMAQYNLGTAYLMKNDFQQAEFWLNKVVEASPKYIAAHLKLGQAYVADKKPEKAAPHFKTAMSFYENALEETSSGKIRAGLQASLAEIQYSAGELQKAKENLNKAIQQDPQKPSLHYNLAQVYEGLNDREAAIKEYGEEIRVNPADFRAFTNMGILYYETKRFDDAARCFQKSVELNPRDPRGYLQLATVYKVMGRNEDAERVMRMVQQQQPMQ